MVLIHVPPVLRLNGTTGVLYFQFETTYFLEVECYYESIYHPQKIPMTYHKSALDATGDSSGYENYLMVPPNRHLHGQMPKGMQHNHSTHVIHTKPDKPTGLTYGQFVNK